MIDWHSHILPSMDDGSKDAAESVAMLEMLSSQGVSTVVATPHFYANDESVESFLERRGRSLDVLKPLLTDEHPSIVSGAEVKYYQGISRMSGLPDLRVEGSEVLLLEMPFGLWTEYMIRELSELSSMSGVTVVLAHVERYLKFQKTKDLDRIFENGILAQANATFFTSFVSRHKALSLLKKGAIQFVGSDGHNTESRPPLIKKAFDVISKKFGDDYIGQMNEYGYSVLCENYESI